MGKTVKVDKRAFRSEVSRLASMANKRLARLENAGLESSPAYKKWVSEGGEKFGLQTSYLRLYLYQKNS